MNTVGVIVGRFQVSFLHAGHLALITEVMSKHSKVMIVLGSPPPKNADSHDPLSLAARQGLFEQFTVSKTSSVLISSIIDHEDDAVWSKELDMLIRNAFPTEEVVLYGGKDSFINYYSGKFTTVVVDKSEGWSGTDLREEASGFVPNSVDYRKGVIAALTNRFPVSYQCVDIALYDTEKDRVLMAKKPKHFGDQHLFPGGFVDPADPSLEAAAARELREETHFQNVHPNSMQYLSSYRIADWRYKNSPDKILTSFFCIDKATGWGRILPGDDVPILEWVPINIQQLDNVRPNHRSMFTRFMQYYWNEIKKLKS